MTINHNEYAKRFADNLVQQGVQFQGCRILDIGIGNDACLAREMQRRGGEVYAIDKDSEAVRSVISSGDLPESRVKCLSAEKLADGNPFDQPFDLVICSGVMEYMDQPQRASMIHGLHRHCLALHGKCALVVDQYTEEKGHASVATLIRKVQNWQVSGKQCKQQQKWIGAILTNYFDNVIAVDVRGGNTLPLLFLACTPKTLEQSPISPCDGVMSPEALLQAADGYRLMPLPGTPIYEDIGHKSRRG